MHSVRAVCRPTAYFVRRVAAVSVACMRNVERARIYHADAAAVFVRYVTKSIRQLRACAGVVVVVSTTGPVIDCVPLAGCASNNYPTGVL